VDQLKAQGQDTTQAEATLDGHKALLRFLREDLEHVKTQAGCSFQH
jgi:aerobic-type carbon monoxide dehydrogenase small subunit (CoxS/CutS family)